MLEKGGPADTVWWHSIMWLNIGSGSAYIGAWRQQPINLQLHLAEYKYRLHSFWKQ